jgi:hypothetical protein
MDGFFTLSFNADMRESFDKGSADCTLIIVILFDYQSYVQNIIHEEFRKLRPFSLC